MTLPDILRRAEKLTIDNSPAILTAIGVTGTVTTAVLTGKATFEASHVLSTEVWTASEEFNDTIPLKEKIKPIWKLYIPPAISGAVTIAAIIGANRIGTRRAAAVATAYALSEKAYSEYKEKVVEKLGNKKEQELRDEIAQDRVNRKPIGNTEVIITGGGEVLCFDHFTGRYFMSSVETLKKAQNDINYKIINSGYASLSDFYEMIGIPMTSFSEEVGWNTDGPLELLFSTTMSEDQKPCIAIDFNISPIRNYYRCWAE